MTETNIDLCEIHTIGQDTREWLVSPSVCPSLTLYGVVLTGITHASADFRFVRHAPPFSQLLVCFGGSGVVWIDSGWRECTAGHAYLTPPGVFHGYHAVPHESWELCWVMYAADKQHVIPAADKAPALLRADTDPLAAAVQGLYRESMGQAEATVMHHWASLMHAHAQRVILPPSRLQAVWDTVRADLAYPWSVDELAAIAVMSPEHLRRISLAEVNKSPLHYVTDLRMRQATALLASESYTIEEIAERVGYNNPFAFSTAFKRCVGMAPSLFRGKTKIRTSGDE
jgi:AraC-like DNA-binding protein